jgi:hypothetical protein
MAGKNAQAGKMKSSDIKSSAHAGSRSVIWPLDPVRPLAELQNDMHILVLDVHGHLSTVSAGTDLKAHALTTR